MEGYGSGMDPIVLLDWRVEYLARFSIPIIYIYIYIYIYYFESNSQLGLTKFDTTREYETNPTRFLQVLIKYNRVWIISVLTRLTCLINMSYPC